VTKGELTRLKIVESAAPIFNQHGYEGTSLAALMAATGLKKGGIYRHFASKEELAAAAFDYTWETAWKLRMLDVEEQSGGLAKLKRLIDNFIAHRPPIAGGCPILNTAVDADDGNQVLRDRVAAALRSWRLRLQDILQEAAERGEIRDGADLKSVATLIIASLEGSLMISRLERTDDEMRRIRKYLYDYLDTAVAAPASQGART